jgi:hypothetical protein
MFGTGDIRIAGMATPTAGATVELFNSATLFAKAGLQTMGIVRVKLSFPGLNQPSAAGGLIGYKSPDKGATWYPATFAPTGASNALPQTVAADTGSDSNSYNINVSTETDVKFTFTASGTAPTIWAPVVTLQYGNPSSG